MVVDLGCGPGTDLGAIADRAVPPGRETDTESDSPAGRVIGTDRDAPAGRVIGVERDGANGRVIGIDRDERMLAEARRRFEGRPSVSLETADLHALPLATSSVDRARTDRVLQHVDSPERVLAEVRRVLRPGGVLVTAEPDWDTVAVADDDAENSRRFARFLAGQVRNPTVGRQLPRLAARTGFTVDAVEAVAVLFRDFQTADRILGLRRHGPRAIADAGAWLGRLATGPFVAGFTLYLARFRPADANGPAWQPDPPAGAAGSVART